VIAPSRPRALIRRRKERIDFLPAQERHQCARESLGRDGEHALDLRGMLGCLEGNVAEERVDGGQTKVPRSRRHVVNFLKLIKEISHQDRVDVVEALA
jgi:hypothetical protein